MQKISRYKKGQVNKMLLSAIIFVALLILLIIFIMARKGNMTDLLGAIPTSP